jgi:4-carboxymuconolactone decarboxylase
MSEDRMEKGRAIRAELMGEAMTKAMAATVYDDPMMRKFGDYAIDAVFAGLWGRPGLDLKTRALICCVSDVATAAWPELKIHLHMARGQGWTEDELSEALLHMAGYVGLPKVREAMIIAREVFEGMRDEVK